MRFCASFSEIERVRVLMQRVSAARDQRGALTQAGAGIAAPRRFTGDFARLLLSLVRDRLSHERCTFNAWEESMTKKLIPLTLAAGLLAGCALTSNPKIADIKYNPGRYQNHTVTVDGVVTSSWGVPLMPVKLYKVNDGTGEVTVISQHGQVPAKGARVSVKGRVNEFATFGGQSVGLHLEEEKVHFKR
jgi:hypothetical protein